MEIVARKVRRQRRSQIRPLLRKCRNTTVSGTTSESRLLLEIVSRLVKAYSPKPVYLFGSVARGEAAEDSDIDLLLVMPDDAAPERRRGSLAFHALRGIDASVDVVVWTRGYFDSRQSVRSSLPAVIAREGKLLYAT